MDRLTEITENLNIRVNEIATLDRELNDKKFDLEEEKIQIEEENRKNKANIDESTSKFFYFKRAKSLRFFNFIKLIVSLGIKSLLVGIFLYLAIHSNFISPLSGEIGNIILGCGALGLSAILLSKVPKNFSLYRNKRKRINNLVHDCSDNERNLTEYLTWNKSIKDNNNRLIKIEEELVQVDSLLKELQLEKRMLYKKMTVIANFFTQLNDLTIDTVADKLVEETSSDLENNISRIRERKIMLENNRN